MEVRAGRVAGVAGAADDGAGPPYGETADLFSLGCVLFSLLGEVANVLGGLVVAGRADQQLPLLRLVLTTRAAATRATATVR